MARAAVEIHGGRHLRRTLRQAGVDLKELKAVNHAAGQVVLDEAIRTTPVGSRAKRARTKRLRTTLRVFASTSGARVRAGSKAVPYAGPIHWGWPAKNIRAQPFIADAAHTTEPKWLQLYVTHLRTILSTIKGA